MNLGRSLFVAMILKILSRFCMSESDCEYNFEASTQEKSIVSSDYTQDKTGPFTCNWIINSFNSTYVIKFKMTNIVTQASILCGSDQVIVRDGITIFGRPLRIWCKNSNTNETFTSYSSAIHVQFITSSNDLGDLMFIMSYWAAPQENIIVAPIDYGVANYILIVISALVGGGFICFAILLVYRERKKHQAKQETKFKQKLGVRRQGISGASGGLIGVTGVLNESFKMEESSSPGETSFTLLSPTPTSLFSV